MGWHFFNVIKFSITSVSKFGAADVKTLTAQAVR